MDNLLITESFNVYRADGLRAFKMQVGDTVKGKYDALVGGWVCFVAGIQFCVFPDECVSC